MTSDILAILLFCFTTSFTPGPNNLMLMSSGLTFGARRTMPHYLGVAFGFPVMVLVVSFGFGQLFVKYPFFHKMLLVGSVLYMLYLAWKIARSHRAPSKIKKTPKPLTFIQAALFQWVNPKAWVMAIGVISIFRLNGGGIFTEYFAIPLLFLTACLPSAGAWMLLGHTLQRFLKNPVHVRRFNYAMAICLVLSIATFFLE